MPPLLEVENLRVTFFSKKGPLHAVDGVSYRIGRGETLGIVGESGCGKSVTSYAVLGILDNPGRVTGGRVVFDGNELTRMTEAGYRRLRGSKIAMIFQEPMTALNPVLTVGAQIVEQILAHEDASRTEAKNLAVERLREVGIPAPERRAGAYPHELSGGMRQRAMIAMALSCNPELLIADEPTTALDVTIQAQILELIARLKAAHGMAVQFITHDLGVISEIADRVAVMYAGKIVEESPAGDIFASPRHPYTRGLMCSIPSLDSDVTLLPVLNGAVPPPGVIPRGCRFRNRCPNAIPACAWEEPEMREITPGHGLACFNPEGGG